MFYSFICFIYCVFLFTIVYTSDGICSFCNSSLFWYDDKNLYFQFLVIKNQWRIVKDLSKFTFSAKKTLH